MRGVNHRMPSCSVGELPKLALGGPSLLLSKLTAFLASPAQKAFAFRTFSPCLTRFTNLNNQTAYNRRPSSTKWCSHGRAVNRVGIVRITHGSWNRDLHALDTYT